MTTLKLNQTVYTSTGLEGTVLELNGNKTTIDFNGTVKTMLTMLLKSSPISKKIKSYLKEEEKEVVNFKSIVNNLKGSSKNRNKDLFVNGSIYNDIERLADSKNHFAGSILEDVRNGKSINEKQACLVAYFAQENNIF